MATAKFDDGLLSNPKIIAAGAAACWLWFASVLYCRRGLTDGHIPRIVVPSLVVGLKSPYVLAAKLVTVRLWDQDGQDFQVHGFLDWNPSKAQIEEYRATDRERKQARFPGGTVNRNPSGLQTDSERIPDSPARARVTSAGAKSASVSASAVSESEDLPEKSARETTFAISPARPAGLIDGAAMRLHGTHAWCSLPERDGLCVHARLHDELVGKLGRPGADGELRAWYRQTVARFRGQSIGEDVFVFWRNCFAAWVGTVTSQARTGASKTGDTMQAARDSMAERLARLEDA